MGESDSAKAEADAPPAAEAPPARDPPKYRRSHPVRAFVLMTVFFVPLSVVLLIPFVGWVILLVLLPLEFGRIGGRRISRGDALWVAVPAGAAVATYELSLLITILSLVPGTVVLLDALGFLAAVAVYGANTFFFSVGALSTAFDPHEPVSPDSSASSAL